MGLHDKPEGNGLASYSQSQKSLSPERQLLKLIEEPQAKGLLQAAAVKHQGLSLFSFSAWLGRFF